MTKGFIEADHYSKVPPTAWKWRNFSPAEIACRGTGKIRVSIDAMNKLQALRAEVGGPLIINSAYRSPEHNRAVGGAKDSQHVQGIAFDVSMANHEPGEFEEAARRAGFTGFGFYPPKKGNFIHIDTGRAREWGTRWSAPRFGSEAEPKPRTAGKAAVTTLLSTAGAGIAGVADPDNLKQVQETVTPWLAYAPQFQAVFMACGAGILAWMFWNRFMKKAP